MKSFGAYRGSFDPSVVFVYAMAHAPGGKFSAIRVGGRWRPFSLTIGELVEDFEPIKASAEVASLLKSARLALFDPEEIENRVMLETLRRRRTNHRGGSHLPGVRRTTD